MMRTLSTQNGDVTMLNNLKIETGIEVPKKQGPRGGLSNMLRSMAPGDSVLCPLGAGKNTASSTAHKIGVETGRRFVVRRVEDGYRIWRSE